MWLQLIVVIKFYGQNNNYAVKLDHIPIKCDNTSIINLTKNSILYSRTKHIDIRHHFLRDHLEKGDCNFELVDISNQIANIFY